jgi:hypothetical protein
MNPPTFKKKISRENSFSRNHPTEKVGQKWQNYNKTLTLLEFHFN